MIPYHFLRVQNNERRIRKAEDIGVGNRTGIGNVVRGFTVIETLVAIAVLTIALIGPFYAVQEAMTQSFVARDKLIASSLAQEAIEYVRSVRDNNYHNNRSSWMTGLSTLACYGASPTQFCTVDPTRGDVNIVPAAMTVYTNTTQIPQLRMSSAGLYTHQTTSGDSQTRFTRYIQIITTPGSTTEVRIIASVSWTTARVTYTTTISSYVNNWL
jgi:Tfp pilus assembly protein PilV